MEKTPSRPEKAIPQAILDQLAFVIDMLNNGNAQSLFDVQGITQPLFVKQWNLLRNRNIRMISKGDIE